jgi:hypothetical protein
MKPDGYNQLYLVFVVLNFIFRLIENRINLKQSIQEETVQD